jgi:hypothetical protein
MLAAALLKNIEDAGVGILTLVEGVEDRELLASRLTRQEVTRQLRQLVQAAVALPAEQQASMPEIPWDALATCHQALDGPSAATGLALDEALLMAIHGSVPAALMWMRVYRQQHPEWFKLTPA